MLRDKICAATLTRIKQRVRASIVGLDALLIVRLKAGLKACVNRRSLIAIKDVSVKGEIS